MKKTLLFTAATLLLCNGLQARQWDFTNWSSETINNLIADEKWTNQEKNDAGAALYEGCYWYKWLNGGTVIDIGDAGVRQVRHEFVDVLHYWN